MFRFGSCWSSFPRNASFSSFGFVRRAVCRRHSYKWKRWKCAKFEKFYSFFLMAHYNIGFGLMDESGHVDFYINGGDNQPECSIISFQYDIANLISSLRKEIPCSHDRAVSLFNDALLPNSCQSVGYQCASMDAFKRVKRIYISSFNNFILLRVIIHNFTQGDCASCGEDNTRCALFGMRAESYPSRSLSGVRLFLNTAGRAPFCRNQIIVHAVRYFHATI